VKTRSITPVSLRDKIEIHDPLQVVSGYLESWRFEAGDASSSFGESDLRLANRGGARISAAEIAATLEGRRAIELALDGDEDMTQVIVERIEAALSAGRAVGQPPIQLAIGTSTARDGNLQAAQERADAQMLEAKRLARGVSSRRMSG
jgi:hypothetical protein